MNTSERIITIFGGSKCREGDPEYSQALQVGEMLADAGFTICTGGYSGVMEAADHSLSRLHRSTRRHGHGDRDFAGVEQNADACARATSAGSARRMLAAGG